MSYDRQLDQACTHEVVDEFLFVQDDRQTVSPIRPISSATSVRLRLNGVSEVPSSGVQIAARTVGTKEGPFSIGSTNNVFAIQINDDPVQTISLPYTAEISSSRLADTLTSMFSGLVFFSERNRVGIRSTLLGRESTFRIHSSSTLAATLGLVVDCVFRGKDVFPGWTLVSSPNSVSDRPLKYIVFDDTLQADSNYVEVCYYTVREECRRCGGSGVEHDWRYGVNGQILLVQDEQLLIQELLKITYTVRNSNPFHPWYGTTLIERIGSKNASTGVLQNTITSDIYTTFARWQSIKKTQEEAVGQEVTDEEYPYRLLGVQLEQSQEDPTVLFVNVTVQNRSANPFTLSRGLKLSEPLNLLTDTKEEGVFKQSLRNFTLVG